MSESRDPMAGCNACAYPDFCGPRAQLFGTFEGNICFLDPQEAMKRIHCKDALISQLGRIANTHPNLEVRAQAHADLEAISVTLQQLDKVL